MESKRDTAHWSWLNCDQVDYYQQEECCLSLRIVPTLVTGRSLLRPEVLKSKVTKGEKDSEKDKMGLGLQVYSNDGEMLVLPCSRCLSKLPADNQLITMSLQILKIP